MLDFPARERVGQSLDILDDGSQMLTTRGIAYGPEEQARSTAAVTAPHRVCPITRISLAWATRAAVFHAAEHLAAGDISGDAHGEDVAHAQVEDQLGRRAGVDTAEHDRQRVLPRPLTFSCRPRSRVSRWPDAKPRMPVLSGYSSTCCGVIAFCNSRVE